MSPATVDRALKPLREQTKARRGISTTKVGTLLKRQIAIRTFADRRLDRCAARVLRDGPGRPLWLEWRRPVPVHAEYGRRSRWLGGLRRAAGQAPRDGLPRATAPSGQSPVRILGLDSDNGTEFINRALLDYCTDQGITFTRSRPYLKNDTCHVEQKNWAVVRRLVGYSKTRTGPRVTRRYDVARTPFHRLLDTGVLSIKMMNQLKARSKHIDPYQLKVQLEAAQRTLAVRSDSYVRQPEPSVGS